MINTKVIDAMHEIFNFIINSHCIQNLEFPVISKYKKHFNLTLDSSLLSVKLTINKRQYYMGSKVYGSKDCLNT